MNNRPNEKIVESAVGEIHMPNTKVPFDLDIQTAPNLSNQIPSSEGYGVSTTESGIQKEKPGFLKTYGTEFYDWNVTLRGAHIGYEAYEAPDPYLDIPPTGWTPKSAPEMFYDIKPEYLDYLAGSQGPKDLQYRRDRVLAEQQHDETLENGSMLAKLLGGLSGAVLDPVNLIPVAATIKYAKMAPTILKGAARALPGMSAIGVLQAGSHQLDRVNGNLHDFVVESIIDTTFGSLFVGAGKGAGLLLDKMELWNLRKIAVPGIDYALELGEKNNVIGIKATDTTGNLSAAVVSHAQEIANSSFMKSGFFKIPYAGSALLAIKGAPIIGSPLVAMVNSSYKTVQAFIDRAADHSFYRTGILKGEASPKSHEHLMKQEFAELRGMASQMNALHLERNGFDIRPRILNDLTRLGLGLYNKSLKLLQKDMEKDSYISRDAFNSEIENVLFTDTQSEHAAVNEAASIAREKIDRTWKLFNESRGKAPSVVPPKFAKSFLMRVYDTPYLNINKGKWDKMVVTYLRESDALITHRLHPLKSLEQQIQEMTVAHQELIKHPNVQNEHVKESSDRIEKMKKDLKYQNDKLQNELRTNEAWIHHIDDIFALSADEARELEQLLKPRDEAIKAVAEQQKVISELKSQKSKSKQSSVKGKTVETAKKHAEDQIAAEQLIQEAEVKLGELKNNVTDIEYDLYSKARNGDVNPAFYYPETHQYKSPSNRLKLRDVHESDITRNNLAKAYRDSIMHMNPEDIIADVMGKFGGSKKENTLKSRSVLIPDELLYQNNFMSKDLMSKINNYVLYLSRRTHLKNVFQEITNEGGMEPIVEKLLAEHESITAPWDERKAKIEEQIKKANKRQDLIQVKKLQKENEKLNKKINNETKRFNRAKDQLNISYERMMGLRKREKWEIVTQGVIRSLVAMANLHQLPLTMISDVGAIGLQHGVWPFIKDGVYPIIQSIGTLVKTKDSEAVREAVGHIHLGLQDVLNGHADKNISLETQPYVNMGPWVASAEKLAHFSGNADLTNYIDNWLQRMSAAVIQSKLMKNLHLFLEGKISRHDHEYLLKYGIDPKVWAERMVKGYKESGGFKTTLGGYQSMFWKWTDLEASNEFSSSVFRGVQNTIIQRGTFDSPFWADNLLGMIFHTFTGWTYASMNRYLIPLMQRPDAEKMLGVVFSMGCGSLVSPLRRVARGEDAYPDDMTASQFFYETIADSVVTSSLANVLSYANFLSNDRILGDLKSDKFRNRVGVGSSSVVFGTANKLKNIIESIATGEINEKDTKEAAHLFAVTGSLYGRQISDSIIEKLGLPPNRRAAHAENQ